MDDGDLIERGQRLSEDLRHERKQAESNGWRYSAELRAQVVAYAIACCAEGESHQCIAGRLGMAQPMLSRWIRKSRNIGGGWRPVAIVPSTRGRTTTPAARPMLRLVSPHGFVVDGLAPEVLAYLLRVLG